MHIKELMHVLTSGEKTLSIPRMHTVAFYLNNMKTQKRKVRRHMGTTLDT